MPLSSDWLGFFGVLLVAVVVLVFIGVSIAATLGPIALVIGMIVKAMRTSDRTVLTPGGDGAVRSGSTVVVSQTLGDVVGRVFTAGIGLPLQEVMAMAAAQQPLQVQLASTVMAIDAARRAGNAGPYRALMSERFAAGFAQLQSHIPGGGFPRVSVQLAAGAGPGDRLVVRVDRDGVLPHPEYWTFVRANDFVPGMPAECPKCGAPTAGNPSGTCRFCGARLATSAPPSVPRWLVDQISDAPHAQAA